MELIEREKDESEVNLLSPLTWAYVGDAIYELYIRTNLVNKTKLKPHKLHISKISFNRSSFLDKYKYPTNPSNAVEYI
mgnify:CR=1 FL=1